MISGLVLAAGAGLRLGRPKADLVIAGRRLVDVAVDIVRAGGCAEVLVVARGPLAAPPARTVINRQPELGMGSSLRLGLDEISGEACVVVLVDELGITKSDVAAVIAAYRSCGTTVVARRGGRRSHPVLLARSDFEAVAAQACGDFGARAFLDSQAGALGYVDLPGTVSDIDTPADLARACGATPPDRPGGSQPGSSQERSAILDAGP